MGSLWLSCTLLAESSCSLEMLDCLKPVITYVSLDIGFRFRNGYVIVRTLIIFKSLGCLNRTMYEAFLVTLVIMLPLTYKFCSETIMLSPLCLPLVNRSETRLSLAEIIIVIYVVLYVEFVL